MKADFFYETMLDRQSDVRFIAALILAGYYKADQKIVIDKIMEAITCKNWRIRGLAAIYLGGVDKTDQKIIHTLMETLKDKEPGVRLNAAEAMGKIYQAKSAEELLELLKHPSSSYRIAGACALARKKSISAQTMNRIIELKDNDKRPWVRLGAWEAFIRVQESQEKEKKKE
jgi:HEAT repeat protein